MGKEIITFSILKLKNKNFTVTEFEPQPISL